MGLSSSRTQIYCYVYSSRKNFHCCTVCTDNCCLIPSLLFLHFPTFFISTCLNLPFGTWRRCRRLKPDSFCIKEGRGGSCLVSFLPESISLQHPRSGTHHMKLNARKHNSIHDHKAGTEGTTPLSVLWQMSQRPRVGHWI